jgi:hypothetical protein
MVHRISGQRQTVLEVLGSRRLIVYALPDFRDLNIFEEKKNQIAPPRTAPEYFEPTEVVPYDDGWPGYFEQNHGKHKIT